MDLSKIKDVKDLQVLLDLMEKYDLAELEVCGDGRTVRLRKAEAAPQAREVVHLASAPAAAASPVAAPGADSARDAETAAANLNEISSPMVGSFYRAPSPEAEPFVREGDRVEEETTVCIIEAMKVMNEIPAGASGILREALVKNGEAVEYGQALFRIEPE